MNDKRCSECGKVLVAVTGLPSTETRCPSCVARAAALQLFRPRPRDRKAA